MRIFPYRSTTPLCMCMLMRIKKGCGLGLHVLPHIERTTIRARAPNKLYRNLTFGSSCSGNKVKCNLFLLEKYKFSMRMVVEIFHLMRLQLQWLQNICRILEHKLIYIRILIRLRINLEIEDGYLTV